MSSIATNRPAHPQTEDTPHRREDLDTVVIGGGQAGLAAGRQLQRTGRSFVILDAHPRVGDAWRTRWDNLVLFTPNRLNAMPGMRFPGPRSGFATKDEFADFLEAYATRFELPVRTATRVERVTRDTGGRFVVRTSAQTYVADNVIVAMNSLQRPKVPAFAGELAPGITQLHSAEYRSTDQLSDGPVLIVGVGNSGADIATEVLDTHETWLAGTPMGAIPWHIETRLHIHLMSRLMRFVGHRVLNVANPLGRRLQPKFLSGKAPLIRVKPHELVEAGVRRTGRITGVVDGRPVTDDGTVLDVTNVIWATGYRPAFSWLELPVLSERGHPLHRSGVVDEVPGLYFLGLEFLRSVTSATITGLGRDARRVVRHLDRHRPVTVDPVASRG